MVRTSSMSGRLRRVTGSLVRSAAATAGKAAFLLPLGRTRPFSRARPSITNAATTVSAQAEIEHGGEEDQGRPALDDGAAAHLGRRGGEHAGGGVHRRAGLGARRTA